MFNSNTHITRNIEIDFTIEHIKECIEKVVKIGAYSIHSKNEVFNTYSIDKLDGLELVKMNITLKKIDETKTSINIDVIERLRNSGHEAVVNRVIDNFLDRLSKALTGQSDEEIKKAAKGCLGLVILFLLSVSIYAATKF